MKEEEEEMTEKKLDLEVKKEFAKIAMTATLAMTVITAPFLKQNRIIKNIHTGAGALLAGAALWHHFLYQPDKQKNKKQNITES